MKSIEQIKSVFSQHMDYIKEQFHVVELGCFGSFVKNSQREDSDVDVLVSFEKGHKDFFNYMRLKNYLEDITGLKVDLVIKEAVKPQIEERIFSEVTYV